VVEFISSATGNLVSPTSASITLDYFVSGVATSTTIDLVQENSFWTATWSSVGVDLGDVVWTTASSATTNPAATGTIRIIDP
jgi:hypothetical protein